MRSLVACRLAQLKASQAERGSEGVTLSELIAKTLEAPELLVLATRIYLTGTALVPDGRRPASPPELVLSAFYAGRPPAR